MFRTVPLSIITSFSLYTQQTCMTCTTVVCTVKNSWWWTQELSETCRVYSKNKFEKLVHLVWFYCKKQWPLSNNTQHSQETDIHVPGGIQTHNPSRWEAADPRLRPRGHRALVICTPSVSQDGLQMKSQC